MCYESFDRSLNQNWWIAWIVNFAFMSYNYTPEITLDIKTDKNLKLQKF